MSTETIDKLYLELSLISTAKTKQQLILEARCARRGRLLQDIFNNTDVSLPAELKQRVSDELMGIAKP